MKNVLVFRSTPLLLVFGTCLIVVHTSSYSSAAERNRILQERIALTERDRIIREAEESRAQHLREYMSKIPGIQPQPQKAIVPTQSLHAAPTVSPKAPPSQLVIPLQGIQGFHPGRIGKVPKYGDTERSFIK